MGVLPMFPVAFVVECRVHSLVGTANSSNQGGVKRSGRPAETRKDGFEEFAKGGLHFNISCKVPKAVLHT